MYAASSDAFIAAISHTKNIAPCGLMHLIQLNFFFIIISSLFMIGYEISVDLNDELRRRLVECEK